MSGAAGIAAAKNRRSKPDPNQKPIVSCSSKSGNCPLPPQNTRTQPLQARGASVLDEDSLQINGPMPLMHVLKVHEIRLNKIDEKLSQTQTQSFSRSSQPSVMQSAVMQSAGCDKECYERLSTLEEKIHMLEEVIMNLQLTLTNVQSFAMETSLAMMKLQKQIPAIVPADVIVPVTLGPVTLVPVTPTLVEPIKLAETITLDIADYTCG